MTGLDVLQFALLSLSAVAALAAGVALSSRFRRFDGQLFTVAAPQAAGSAEQFFMALHGLLRPALRRLLHGQPWIGLELVGRAAQVRFQIWIPNGQKPFVESLLRAAYPGIELSAATEEARAVGSPDALASVHLARGNYLPIRFSLAIGFGRAFAPVSSRPWVASSSIPRS